MMWAGEPSGNASRNAATVVCHRDRAHVVAHHLADGQIAHPADIGGAADGFAAQMEAPSGERIAEHLAGDLRRNDHGDQHRRRQPQITGGLQRDEGHGHRAADHRGRKSAHADHRIDIRIEMTAGKSRAQRDREQVAAKRTDQQRGKEQAAAESAAERDDRSHDLEHEKQRHGPQRQLQHSGKVQRAVAGRHHLRRHGRYQPNQKSTDPEAQRVSELQAGK